MEATHLTRNTVDRIRRSPLIVCLDNLTVTRLIPVWDKIAPVDPR